MFVLTNIEARSLNNFRCRKVIIINIRIYPYSSVMQSVCAVFYCHLWPVWHYHCFHVLHKRYNFPKKKIIEHKNLF